MRQDFEALRVLPVRLELPQQFLVLPEPRELQDLRDQYLLRLDRLDLPDPLLQDLLDHLVQRVSASLE